MRPAARSGTLGGVEDSELYALAHRELDFNAPLSDARVTEIIASLGPLHGARVLDLGCGWAELLLRILAAEPTTAGHGVERDPLQAARARANAAARGLTGRLVLEQADATTAAPAPADVVVSVGASHLWGGTRQTLLRLRPLVRPGGRLLLGDGFWERPPTAQALEVLEAGSEQFGTLADLVDLAVGCGYRPLAVAAADGTELDTWESRWCRGLERWLLETPDPDPADAAQVRALADGHRGGWLRGYRGVLGFAYLTLARPHDSRP